MENAFYFCEIKLQPKKKITLMELIEKIEHHLFSKMQIEMDLKRSPVSSEKDQNQTNKIFLIQQKYFLRKKESQNFILDIGKFFILKHIKIF